MESVFCLVAVASFLFCLRPIPPLCSPPASQLLPLQTLHNQELLPFFPVFLPYLPSLLTHCLVKGFVQCLGQDAWGQWLLFQLCLSEKPFHLPGLLMFIQSNAHTAEELLEILT